jgi:hypothetical protein
MKFGHCAGTKRERTGATPQFDALQAAHLARIEAELAAQPQTITPTLSDADAGYTDWEISVDGERFLVINEEGPDGDWELRQLVDNGWQNDWQLVGVGADVTTFIRQYNVVLA